MAVQLGFLEDIEEEKLWVLKSKYFPSKVGGKPSWLGLKNLPEPQSLRCPTCNEPTQFLLQIYAPKDDVPHAHHRSLFVFFCTNSKCLSTEGAKKCLVFRSQLPQENEFYTKEEADLDKDTCDIPCAADYNKLCKVCGCLEHSTYENHTKESFVFREQDIVLETEEILEPSDNEEEEEADDLVNVEEVLETLKPSLQNEDDAELLKFCAKGDKVASYFCERIKPDPQQILRYSKKPLWVGSTVPIEIPNCDCGAKRIFEFQVMPNLLNILPRADTLDWGILAVYTCSAHCSDGLPYKSEYVYMQHFDN